LAALQGRQSELVGAGAKAGNAKLDDSLAPATLSPQLRALFARAGDIFDNAFPIDLKGLRAALLPQQFTQEAAHIQELASSLGLRDVEIYVSGALGSTCMPVCSTPSRILLGEALLKHEDQGVKDFLLLRALRLVQARMSVLTRTAPVDLWPVVGGFLSLFADGWQPQGADPDKVRQAASRLKAAFPVKLESDIPTLALEVIGAIGNRASQLGALANQWGSRTALLATGDPMSAFLALALAAGRPEGPPTEGDERLRWIVRNPEARDIAVFSVDQKYLEARNACGL
jgi:hypothetical protein